MRYQYELAKYKLNLFTAAVVAVLKMVYRSASQYNNYFILSIK